MADILTAPVDQPCEVDLSLDSPDIEVINLLRKDYYLGEFCENATLPDGTTFDEVAKVRDNLNVYSRNEVEDMVDREHDHMVNTVSVSMQNHLNTDDPHGTKAYANSVVRLQGLTFTTQLNTLRSNLEDAISRGIVGYLKTSDFETFKSNIYNTLNTELSKVYRKSKLYTKDEIDSINLQFVKKNGTVPFTKPLEGMDPILDRHLATKRYVDNLYSHVSDFLSNIEFRTWINQKLAEYAKLTDTYNRDTIDNKLQNLVDSVVEGAINRALANMLSTHIELEDPHGDRAYADGKFVSNESLSTLTEDDLPLLANQIKSTQQVWQTTAPVQQTVGFIESGTDFNEKAFTLQGIMDAIFYGKLVHVYADETVVLGSETNIVIKVEGSLETVDYILVKQNGVTIANVPASLLNQEGEYDITSDFIFEDTTFVAEVYYIGSNEPVVGSTVVAICNQAFIGIIDKYGRTDSITWQDMVEASQSDSTNNKFFKTGVSTIPDLEMNFNFEASQPKQIFIAVPATHPSISEMSTTSQQFGILAFNIIDLVPLNVELDSGHIQPIMYKYMVYKQPLSTLSTKVNFKF